MKWLFIFFIVLSSTSQKTHCQTKISYDYFGIIFYPKKCIDTLVFEISKGEFANCNAKFYLEDCYGKSKFVITDKNSVTRLTGYYASATDTLIGYNNAKVSGKPQGQYYYQVRVLKYFAPLYTGVWVYYNKKGKEIDQLEYHFEKVKSED